MTREGGVIPGFVGFDTTVTSELSYVPAVHGAEEIDNLVDADFRLVLRKLSKRDVVTRLKAVQDFGSMCQERDAEEVKGVLPYWPRIYCKISVDHDRRIREATQQAFEQLVLKVRRSLAPFLKSLMGHWILSQCDTYTPAASAACQAFQAAFSPAKQPEALSFCKEEILNVLQDVLLKETADTLSDPQSVTEEEREAKYVRMLTSSLLGVKRLLSLLLQNDRVALEQRLAQLVTSAKFWKYSKHKTPQVRGAFFEMMCALCEFTPGLVQAEAARLCPTVLLSIDDTDPVVLPPVWEAVLHVVATIPDCWTHVNAKKGFLPKLWALLKEGGKGMAKALHPNLMPLLSKLPQEVTDPTLDFYTTFFTSFLQGLSSERAATSPSESAVIVTSVVECLSYYHSWNRLSEIPSFRTVPLFLLVTEMLVHWEKKAGLHGEDETNDSKGVFQRLLADFWEGLGLLFVRYVDNEEADPQALEGIAALLQVMRSPERAKAKHIQKKKSVKISFKPEDSEKTGVEGDGVEKPVQMVSELVNEKAFGSPQTQHFEDVVCQLAQLCLVHTLVELEEKIMKDGEQQGELNMRNPAIQFLLEQVVVWLAEKGRTDTEHLVEMVFSSLYCCSWQETTRILNHIATMDLRWGIILQIIQRACADPETLKSCGDWLKGSVLGNQLLGLTEELCKVGRSSPASTSNTHSWTLISLVLSQHHNNEPLIGEVYMEKILEKLHTTLSETKSLSDAGNMEPLISFICDVASTFFSSVQDCLLLLSAEELLLTVFELTAQDQTHSHLSASELLYALQWCKEVEYSPAVVSAYYSLLTDRGLSEGLHSQVPVLDLLKMLYSRSVEDGGLWSLTLENYIHSNNLAAAHSAAVRRLYGSADSLFPVSQSKLSTLQVLCPTMTKEDRETLVALATAGIVNWQENDDVYGCLAVLLCCLKANTQVEEEIVQAILATVMEWRNSKEDWFLFGSDLSKATAEQLNLTVEMMRFLSWLVTHHPTVLGGNQWDFLLCSMLAWLEAASDNVSSLWNPWVQLFVCENATLIVKLNQFFTSPSPDVLEKLPSELAAEWTDFFLEGIYNLLLPLPISITDAFTEPDDPAFPLAVLQSVGVALTYVPVQQLKQNSLPPRFIVDQSTNLPEPLQTLLNTFCPLLLFKARPLQITVYHLLEKVMPQLPECDGEGDNNKSDDDRDEPCLSPPASLMSILSTCEELCDSILAGVQVGEFAVVQPLSVEYSCILGYLLAWKLLLTFFKSSPSHVKSQSVEWELPHLACSVYYSTVQDLPAMVRLWWNSQEKRVSAAVEKFTIKYVSPVLSAQEISSVHSSTQMFDSMTVKARSAAREVIATYSVDDIFIELVIQLPQNYPLGSITVESGRRVGVAVQQWRNWMLQLSTYLTHQNGSIMEGLALWKNNVDKRFEGIEDCMICFSVIHGSNYSLPKKGCRTCKKKFHSACLYKWFTSSNKSTCPLCRETFF
ncbi:E3 ubiquitin-protein ligase listerin [Nibea albiflora]|uniref:E3 ubiquitin-protein ligase listerin n=1 Tax=Nibea albiflora TaxID=240163 RepID=A0ACB7F1A3_NIBAL|nr:E3 ubiquitin-protein ligase listerin [Nibea albiflora]